MCYFVHIIAKKSCNKVWPFSSKGKKYEHEKVRIISADKFYEILTGDRDAFKKVCDALSIATSDYLKSIESSEENNGLNSQSVYEVLKNKSDENDLSVLEQIFRDTFDGYNGF